MFRFIFFFLFFTSISFLFCNSVFSNPSEDSLKTALLSRNGVYVDLAGGYAGVPWSCFNLGAFNGFSTQNGSINTNAKGGFTFGFNIGYQINNKLAIEMAGYDLSTVRGNSNILDTLPGLRLKSYAIDLLLKMMLPLSQRFDFVVKLGIIYRLLHWSDTASVAHGFGDQKTAYISGAFGAGLQYWFDEHWSMNLHYLHFMDKTSGSLLSKQAPSAHLVLVGVSYIFSV